MGPAKARGSSCYSNCDQWPAKDPFRARGLVSRGAVTRAIGAALVNYETVIVYFTRANEK